MTTCSTAQIDSMPTSSAVRARCARLSGKPNGPALAYISPNFMPGRIVGNAARDKGWGRRPGPSCRTGRRDGSWSRRATQDFLGREPDARVFRRNHARLSSRGTAVARDGSATCSRPCPRPKKSWVALLAEQVELRLADEGRGRTAAAGRIADAAHDGSGDAAVLLHDETGRGGDLVGEVRKST